MGKHLRRIPDGETGERSNWISWQMPLLSRSVSSKLRVIQEESTGQAARADPQLESITAYDNLDEILNVDGIEVFAGGPNDLGQSMGFPGQPEHPDCLAATEAGTRKIHAEGKRGDSDIVVSVDATMAVNDAVNALLSSGSGIRGY